MYVAAVSLLVAVLALATAVLRLAAALALRGVHAVQTPIQRPAQRSTDDVTVAAAVPARTATSLATKRLTTALVGMGFRPSAVRAYVASVTADRVESTRIEDLIRDGVATLAA